MYGIGPVSVTLPLNLNMDDPFSYLIATLKIKSNPRKQWIQRNQATTKRRQTLNWCWSSLGGTSGGRAMVPLEPPQALRGMWKPLPHLLLRRSSLDQLPEWSKPSLSPSLSTTSANFAIAITWCLWKDVIILWGRSGGAWWDILLNEAGQNPRSKIWTSWQ